MILERILKRIMHCVAMNLDAEKINMEMIKLSHKRKFQSKL